MLTLGLKEILVSVLLVALIVLVIFIIVLVSKVTDSVKKANNILDTGMDAADSIAEKVNGITSNIASKKDKIGDFANTGLSVAKATVEKVIKR